MTTVSKQGLESLLYKRERERGMGRERCATIILSAAAAASDPTEGSTAAGSKLRDLCLPLPLPLLPSNTLAASAFSEPAPPPLRPASWLPRLFSDDTLPSLSEEEEGAARLLFLLFFWIHLTRGMLLPVASSCRLLHLGRRPQNGGGGGLSN